jgi:tRNA pseudouridine38-40 synthase
MTCHSRFSAIHRRYRYRIHMGMRDPERDRFAFNTWYKIDAKQLNHHAQTLKGVHDFRGFSEELDPEANSVREIFSIQVTQRRDEIHLDIVGTAFLRGMMRRIAGGLFEVGRNHRPAEDLKSLLNPAKRDSMVWPVVLPARGLTLMKIKYGRPYHGESQLYEKETDLEQTIREMNNE